MNVQQINKAVTHKILQALASKGFFIAIIVLFVLQALWLAFTAIYPMPFDEYYHIGIIQEYAGQFSPFITEQSAEASILGDVTRLPSYLYHYLMSFPYRLVDVFTDNQMVLIISMRMLNIALLASAIVLFRHLFIRAGISRRIIHTAALFFVLTFIVPFLGAHVNSDNLMIMLTPLILLMVLKIIQSKQVNILHITGLASFGMFTVLVKHSFIPMFIITVSYAGVVLIWRHRKALPKKIIKSFSAQTFAVKVALVIVLALPAGLLAERYVLNLAMYGAAKPDCAKIQPVEVCQDYTVWYRNQRYIELRPDEDKFTNPVSFTEHWFKKMMRGYFAIFSHVPSKTSQVHEPFGPIEGRGIAQVPFKTAYVVAAVGALAIILKFRRIWQDQFLRFALVSSVAFVALLWAFNYSLLVKIGAAAAIQARYTLPVLLLIFVLIIQALSWQIKSKSIKTYLLLAALAFYTCGGGIASYVARADKLWYWPNETIRKINEAIKLLIKPIIPK